FRNGGADEYYLSSADWMPRNLDRRIEILFPVDDDITKKRLADTLRMQLADTAKSHKLSAEGVYERPPVKSRVLRSQERTSHYFRDLGPPIGKKIIGKLLKPKTSPAQSRAGQSVEADKY
ncbi:MAG: hypothetical protein GXP32_08170, partial [Kiritimatiellaeota bacterium]|nr:hypothetical protein [Kiritimatiellota bacterium]